MWGNVAPIKFNTMANNLMFLETLSLEEAKSQFGSSISVKLNPQTNKFFMTCKGKVIGGVSKKITSIGGLKSPVISLVEGDGETFYLLHNEGEEAETVFTL